MTAKQKYASVAVDDLTLDPANINQHDDAGIGAIAESLRTFGQQKPIVATREHVVAAGNGTVMAAIELGMQTLDVRYTDLNMEQLRAYKIADNQTGRLSAFDDDMLEKELHEIEATLLPALGFPDDELDAILKNGTGELDDGPEPDTDHAAELQKKWKTERGQVWRIGEHRLMCGDATNEADVDRLLPEPAHMMFTDPPYGVDYVGGHLNKRNRERLVGDKSPSVYADFLPVMLPHIDGPCYVMFAGTRGVAVYAALVDCDIHALIIWNKTNATYAAMNAQYKHRHEPFLYFKPKGTTLRWCGPTNECTVWDIARDGRNDKHPTQKPVALPHRAIGNHTAETVVDPFIGAASTMVAAEQLNRKCYGMEIDPAFCAVALQRMDDMGVTAELVDG